MNVAFGMLHVTREDVSASNSNKKDEKWCRWHQCHVCMYMYGHIGSTVECSFEVCPLCVSVYLSSPRADSLGALAISQNDTMILGCMGRLERKTDALYTV